MKYSEKIFIDCQTFMSSENRKIRIQARFLCLLLKMSFGNSDKRMLIIGHVYFESTYPIIYVYTLSFSDTFKFDLSDEGDADDPFNIWQSRRCFQGKRPSKTGSYLSEKEKERGRERVRLYLRNIRKDKQRYSEFKEKTNERNRIHRLNRTPEQIARDKETARARQKRYRLRKLARQAMEN